MSHPTSPISQHLPGHLLLLPLKAEVKQVRVGGGHGASWHPASLLKAPLNQGKPRRDQLPCFREFQAKGPRWRILSRAGLCRGPGRGAPSVAPPTPGPAAPSEPLVQSRGPQAVATTRLSGTTGQQPRQGTKHCCAQENFTDSP